MSRAKKSEETRGVINILGTDWNVVLRPFPPDEQGIPSETFGYCCYHTHEIHINSLKPSASNPDTLLHEMTHAIEYMLGFDTNEERVRGISTAWRSIFKGNPKVARWLTQ
jgi:hypothetical protein